MRIAPLTQGIFWFTTGLWPIVHLRSFEAVTGKKRDTWLVRTMGGLIAAVGGALLVAAFERPTRSSRVLGMASAAALAAADLVFAGKGRISRIYFADAAAEAGLVAAWLATERAQP
jgi:hypothetical protein